MGFTFFSKHSLGLPKYTELPNLDTEGGGFFLEGGWIKRLSFAKMSFRREGDFCLLREGVGGGGWAGMVGSERMGNCEEE